ncbi:hypothetical protein [Lysinibacillus xylanilyticus]|uniref:hypothetical protein n=1 Tax=Lysinibacillus xylanilyticus TaxID=582475 RepID=UPI003CFC60A9
MKTISIIYEDRSVIKYIRRRIDEVNYLITNTQRLESRIFKELECYYESTENRSIKRIRYIIDRAVVLAKKQYGIQKTVVFSDLNNEYGFGESLEFEPEDLLARGGETALENISLNEKIARLASDDRELVTLNAWANGFNDTQVSETLASRFGGKCDSHRKFVQRFRAKCQRKLTA